MIKLGALTHNITPIINIVTCYTVTDINAIVVEKPIIENNVFASKIILVMHSVINYNLVMFVRKYVNKSVYYIQRII